jgi:negative regulator of sigma-B (phosphoserine phosphatase)
MEGLKQSLMEWSTAAFTLPGETECGDLPLVKHFPEGLLVAVVDGLGHGPHAAAAARAALEVLEGHAGEPPVSLVCRCHERLRSTRGAVMSLASFDASRSTMSWISVGNAAGVLLHQEHAVTKREFLLLRAGVVGFELPTLYAPSLRVMAGDLLIFATDGIRSGFADHVNPSDPPQRIADRILARYTRGTDDALVLVARFTNGSHETHSG